jgi:hypothetical protein
MSLKYVFCKVSNFYVKSLLCRNEEWSGGESKNGPNEKDQSYDGPPGMDPDGIIESNWEEVSSMVD